MLADLNIRFSTRLQNATSEPLLDGTVVFKLQKCSDEMQHFHKLKN